ncbi:MAG TPA: LLM class flavin-dependent oxidoreductase [Candidatus Saccharimonadia bacterium]|nr:LLM class flavin-dependent oxidoreductase [Candidatus Saccharimonadia bacterium]
MNFGMFTDFHVRQNMSQTEAFDESFRQVEEAEKLGIDSVWLSEHHFSPERSVLASPLVIASSIATRTQRVRIGLAVQVLPLTNPLRIAEEAATVDHISKGRFDFGVGRSGLTKYYQGYNVPYVESRSRFLEALDIISQAWTQEQFSYSGDHFAFHNVTVVPKPYQKPHPPIRVALASAETFGLVGRMGHAIFVSANTPIPLLQERLALYRQARQEAGHPGPADIALRIPAYVAETAAQARSEPEASTMHAIHYAATELIPTAANPEIVARMQRLANTPYDDILKQRLLYGTPGAVVDRLQEYQDALGITGVVLEMNYGGRIPYERVINSVRFLTEKVAPKFK